MIQHVQLPAFGSARALASLPPERVLPPAGSMLALPHGEIAGDLRASDRATKRRATYELLVANNTAAPIATFTYTVEQRFRRLVTWETIIVPAYSAIAVDIDVALPPSGRQPRVVAELYAYDAHLTLDAKAPPARFAPLAARRILAAAAFAVLAAATLSYAALRPRVLALVAPQNVTSGTPFAVAFTTKGADDARYSVTAADGSLVVAGTLDPHADAFRLALPKTTISSGYDLQLIARGRFGEDARTAHVVALPQPSPLLAADAQPVRVSHLHLESDTIDGGQPIVIRYRSTVPTGTVRLIDQYGTTRAEMLLSAQGRSTLAAPFVDADQDMRIVVSARQGTAQAEAALPVTVRHIEPLSAAAAPNRPVGDVAPRATDERDADAADPGLAEAGPPIAVAHLQIANRPVAVHILHHNPGLRVAMLTSTGDEVASADVAADESTVLLAAPALSETSPGGNYSIVATFARGVSQEMVIRPIVFRSP